MQIKIHDSYRTIVALCDTDLIGKTFSEGIKQIEVRPNFFRGEEKNREEVLDILNDMKKEDATFNIVGKESVELGLETGVIKKEGIMMIDDVPVALGLM